MGSFLFTLSRLHCFLGLPFFPREAFQSLGTEGRDFLTIATDHTHTHPRGPRVSQRHPQGKREPQNLKGLGKAAFQKLKLSFPVLDPGNVSSRNMSTPFSLHSSRHSQICIFRWQWAYFSYMGFGGTSAVLATWRSLSPFMFLIWSKGISKRAGKGDAFQWTVIPPPQYNLSLSGSRFPHFGECINYQYHVIYMSLICKHWPWKNCPLQTCLSTSLFPDENHQRDIFVWK